MRNVRIYLLLTLLVSGCSLIGNPFTGEPDGSNCVPYARWASGISLYGDAYQWWGNANHRYGRGHIPKPGAVLVLAKTQRLVHGHLAVVKEVKSPRLILVDHANWVADEISKDMPVKDVSSKNDWSQLRFWNESAKAFGSLYPASGFIYPANNSLAENQIVTASSGKEVCPYAVGAE